MEPKEIDVAKEEWPEGARVTLGDFYTRNGSPGEWWLAEVEVDWNEVGLTSADDRFIWWRGTYQDFVAQFTPLPDEGDESQPAHAPEVQP